MPDLDQSDIFDALDVPVIILDREYRIVRTNEALARATGAQVAELLGQKLLDAFAESEARKAVFQDAYERAFAGERVVLEKEYYGLRSGDPDYPHVEDRWWTVRIAPLADGAHIVLSVYDDTAEVLASDMAKAVRRELQHRMANLSGLVTIIARRSAKGAADVPSYVKALVGRLEALAHSTRLLGNDDWRGTDLRVLVGAAMEPFGDLSLRRLFLEGPDVQIDAGAAQALAMGLHELATNAAKYGALSLPEGRVNVTWARKEDGALRFVWRESGVSGLAPSERTGFGTTILGQLLPMQLDGEATIDVGPHGLTYALTVGDAHLCGDRGRT
ncbi:MAG: HWE histidine kinase domain-containing protein [Pseudomonadota bacterium]